MLRTKLWQLSNRLSETSKQGSCCNEETKIYIRIDFLTFWLELW